MFSSVDDVDPRSGGPRQCASKQGVAEGSAAAVQVQ
ncbi:hypothetical protein HaLaN_01180 [Haematococcus lacustris]|uniref:Uncharacterized protein n=1 Tax=Haematococcus lacustris TaxID=44745 RepID=A0A699YI29_HAELA|nr:hypothetical protein HaLaN_01180 [Haematococcus lacustris]